MEWFKYVNHKDATVRLVAKYIIIESGVYKVMGWPKRCATTGVKLAGRNELRIRHVAVSAQVFLVDMNSVTQENVHFFKRVPNWMCVFLASIVLPEQKKIAFDTYMSLVNELSPTESRSELLHRIVVNLDARKKPISRYLLKEVGQKKLYGDYTKRPMEDIANGLNLQRPRDPDDGVSYARIVGKYSSHELCQKLAYCVVNMKEQLEKAVNDIMLAEVKRIG
jgi:hypothetical protein